MRRNQIFLQGIRAGRLGARIATGLLLISLPAWRSPAIAADPAPQLSPLLQTGAPKQAAASATSPGTAAQATDPSSTGTPSASAVAGDNGGSPSEHSQSSIKDSNSSPAAPAEL